MADNDNMFHFERCDRIFKRGSSAVIISAIIMVRDKICDVAMYENITRCFGQHISDLHPAITTGNNHRRRELPFINQLFEERLIFGIINNLPGFKPMNEFNGESV